MWAEQCITQCIIANMDIKFQLLNIHAMATQLGLPTTFLTMYECKRLVFIALYMVGSTSLTGNTIKTPATQRHSIRAMCTHDTPLLWPITVTMETRDPIFWYLMSLQTIWILKQWKPSSRKVSHEKHLIEIALSASCLLVLLQILKSDIQCTLCVCACLGQSNR